MSATTSAPPIRPSRGISSDAAADRRRDNERKLMEDTADLEVLQDTLVKSQQFSSQMIDMLNSFDDRLKSFEQAILPIHRSTRRLNQYYENLDRTLVAANRVIQYYDLADVERATISNGPDEANLLPYLESVARITEGLKFLTESKFTSGEKAIYKLRQQQNAGVIQLVTLYKKWLTGISPTHDIMDLSRASLAPPAASSPSHAVPLGSIPIPDLPSPPPADLKRVADLATWLANTSAATPKDTSLPDVADIAPVYIQVRSAAMHKSLSPLANAASDPRTRLEAKASAAFVQLATWFAVFLKSELALLSAMFPQDSSSHKSRLDILDAVAAPTLQAFLAAGNNLLGQIKRSNGKADLSLVFVLFDVLEFWSKRRDELGAVFDSGLGQKSSQAIEGMFDSWTMASLRIVPDFLDEIKQAPKGSPPPDGTVYELTSNAISFLKRLLEYPDSTESILLSIGEADWASTNVTNVEIKYVKSSGVLTRKYFLLALALLESTIEAKARTYKKAPLAVLFQANNTHYILKNLRAGKLLALLGQDCVTKHEKVLKRNRDAFQEQLKPLLELLMDVTVIQGGAIRKDMNASERTGVKEKFSKFNTALEDVVKNFKGCAVADPELRGLLIKDAKALVIPMYERFVNKYQASEFSKHKDKYIKYDVTQVSQMLERLFLNS